MRCNYIPTKIGQVRELTLERVFEEVEQLLLLYTGRGNYELVQ